MSNRTNPDAERFAGVPSILPMANGATVLRADLGTNLAGEVSGIVLALTTGPDPFVTWSVQSHDGVFHAQSGHYHFDHQEAVLEYRSRTGRAV